MHDFCITIPYGAMLIAGGIMGPSKPFAFTLYCGSCGIFSRGRRFQSWPHTRGAAPDERRRDPLERVHARAHVRDGDAGRGRGRGRGRGGGATRAAIGRCVVIAAEVEPVGAGQSARRWKVREARFFRTARFLMTGEVHVD